MYKLLIGTFSLFCLVSLGDTDLPKGKCTGTVECVVFCSDKSTIVLNHACPNPATDSPMNAVFLTNKGYVTEKEACKFDSVRTNYRTVFNLEGCNDGGTITYPDLSTTTTYSAPVNSYSEPINSEPVNTPMW